MLDNSFFIDHTGRLCVKKNGTTVQHSLTDTNTYIDFCQANDFFGAESFALSLPHE